VPDQGPVHNPMMSTGCIFGTLLFGCACDESHQFISANHYIPTLVSPKTPAITKVKLTQARPFLKTRTTKQLVHGALGNSFPDDDKGVPPIRSIETGNSLDITDSKILRLESEITEIKSLISAEEASLLDIQNNGDYTQQLRKDETQRRISRLVDELNRLDRRLDSLEKIKLALINQQNLQLQNRDLQLAGKNFKLRASVLIYRTTARIYVSCCSQQFPRHGR
jgi:hypothetical protein